MVSIEKQEAETKETGQVIQEPLLVEDDGDEWKQLMGNDILKKVGRQPGRLDGTTRHNLSTSALSFSPIYASNLVIWMPLCIDD